jgi:hypothetical protein
MCENLQFIMFVTHIRQELSSIERKVTLIVTHFWQLLSRIFGETLLIVTHIWRNRTCFFLIGAILCKLPLSPGGIFVNPVVSKPSYKHVLQEARGLHLRAFPLSVHPTPVL